MACCSLSWLRIRSSTLRGRCSSPLSNVVTNKVTPACWPSRLPDWYDLVLCCSDLEELGDFVLESGVLAIHHRRVEHRQRPGTAGRAEPLDTCPRLLARDSFTVARGERQRYEEKANRRKASRTKAKATRWQRSEHRMAGRTQRVHGDRPPWSQRGLTMMSGRSLDGV